MKPQELLNFISVLIAFLAFFFGRSSANKSDGKEVGLLCQKIDDMSNDIKRMEKQVDKISDRLETQTGKIQEEQRDIRERLTMVESKVNHLTAEVETRNRV